MKRIKIVVLIGALLILTGCADTLKCEIKTNNYTSKVKIRFENEKPKMYVFSDKMLFNLESTDSEMYYYSKQNEYSDMINQKLAKIRNNADSVTLNIKYNFEKNKSTNENKLLIKKTDTKKDVIKKIEDIGYKCK